MQEKLIAGFMSENMWRGELFYGFYLTTSRIIGVRGYFGGNLPTKDWRSETEAALFKPGKDFIGTPSEIFPELPLARQLSEDEAIKAIELLEEKKDLELKREEVKEVRIKKSKGLKKVFGGQWGEIIIKTPAKEYKVNISNNATEREIQKARDILALFTGEKIQVEEN